MIPRSNEPSRTKGSDAAPRGARARRRYQLTAILLGLITLVAVGVTGTMWTGRGLATDTNAIKPVAGVVFNPATRTHLPVTVLARGDLESSRNHNVASTVEGQTSIIFLKPEGSTVKEGELVCELDSSQLRDKLTDQVISTQAAEADVENSVKTREVAAIALDEFLNGTYPQNLLAAQNALGLAETNLDAAVARYEWSSRLMAKGYVTPSQNASDRDSKITCEINLENARTKLRVLQGYTRQKNITSFRADIDKAVADELAKKAAFALEQSKLRKLERLIAACKMYAPADGMITYANENVGRGGSNQTQIEEGATVRERQWIFRLPDITRLRINAKIHESLVDRIYPGQTARVRVDALPGQVFTGTVEKIQPLADPSQQMNNDIRVYTTLITIDHPQSSLRPGMSAQAEILISQTDDVLVVPIKAVLSFEGKNHVYLQTPQGIVRREVRLGAANDTLVEVVDGVREGDLVATDPVSLMPENERRAVFILASSTARTSDWDHPFDSASTNTDEKPSTPANQGAL